MKLQKYLTILFKIKLNVISLNHEGFFSVILFGLLKIMKDNFVLAHFLQ